MKSNKILNSIQIEDEMTKFEKDYFFYHHDRYSKILNKIKNFKENNGKILDLSCGFGHLFRACFKMRHARLYGCDKADIAQDNILLKKYGVKYKKYDFRKKIIPFQETDFDLVIFSEVIEHFNFYPLDVLKEIHRILNKNGKLIVSTPNLVRLNNRIKMILGKSINYDIKLDSDKGAYYREYSAEELKYLFTKAGFSSVKIFYIHFDYPDENYLINIVNKVFSLFVPSLRSNLLLIVKK